MDRRERIKWRMFVYNLAVMSVLTPAILWAAWRYTKRNARATDDESVV